MDQTVGHIHIEVLADFVLSCPVTDVPPGWPADVKPMVLQELKRLGTDKNNRL